MHFIPLLINKFKQKSWLRISVYTLFVYLLFLLIVPVVKFKAPYTTIVCSANGEIIGARIASDMQWRFPPNDSIAISENLKTCLINFEDRYFYYHPGINVVALARAFYLNIRYGKIVSGGSTITMQVVRMARGNPDRNYFEKFLEILLALRLECSKSKDEILEMYLLHAPLGGNIVGTEAGAWRYYGKHTNQLSWGEEATLAVLPNAPALIYPGRNQDALKNKRNRLLGLLHHRGIIDSTSYRLTCKEPMPQTANSFPNIAPHLTEAFVREQSGSRVVTTIDKKLQETVNMVAREHNKSLSDNHIQNMGILVMDIRSGEVKAYLGNISRNDMKYENNVDMIRARRSSGSILKPFLYAKAMEQGLIMPQSILADIPLRFENFAPKNYLHTYDGAVPAEEALYRSLNIPFISILQKYGIDPFLNDLHNLGITTLDRGADDYGLSLILGGGEVSLWEICGAYASIARELELYNNTRHYSNSLHFMPKLLRSPLEDTVLSKQAIHIDAGAIWCTFEAMKKLTRPNNEQGWEFMGNRYEVAWKTGTSFGYRDAWAVGLTPEYLVGVWVGNSDGEGRPGITGSSAAAPVLFDIFDNLAHGRWFDKPVMALRSVEACSKSGQMAGVDCEQSLETEIPACAANLPLCKYHKTLHLSSDGQWQVNSECYTPNDIVNKKWFILPPIMEWYYRQHHMDYKLVPRTMPGCQQNESAPHFSIIYPEAKAEVYIPKTFDQTKSKVVLKAAHQDNKAEIFWHIDNQFVGSTLSPHELAITPEKGKHQLTLVDNYGNTITQEFTISNKN
ncbi:MAG: penicillin-binding protein 1C [Bacteroidales bacterium]